jgi:hypothetical protein
MERFLETELRKQLDEYQAGMGKTELIPAAQTAAMDVCRELRRQLEMLRNAMTASTQPAN